MFVDNLDFYDNCEIQKTYLEDLVIDHVKENDDGIYDKGRCLVSSSCQNEMLECEEEQVKAGETVLHPKNDSKMEIDEFKTAFLPEQWLDNEEVCKNLTTVPTLDSECFKLAAHFCEKLEDITNSSEGFKVIVDENDAKPDKIQNDDTNENRLQKEGSEDEVPLYTNSNECPFLSRSFLEKKPADKEENFATLNETKNFEREENESNSVALKSSPIPIDHIAFSSKTPSLISDEIKMSKSKNGSSILLLERSERKGDVDKTEPYKSSNFEIFPDTKKDEEEQSRNAGSFQRGAHAENSTAFDVQYEVKIANQMRQNEEGNVVGMIGVDCKAVGNGSADLNNNKPTGKISQEADGESHAIQIQRDCEDQNVIAREGDALEEKRVQIEEDVKATNDVSFHTSYVTVAKQGVDEPTGRAECRGEGMEVASTAGENYDSLVSNPTVARDLPSNSSPEHLAQRSNQFHLIDTASNQEQDISIEEEKSFVYLKEPFVNSQREIEYMTDFSKTSEADTAAKNSTTEVFATALIGEDIPEEHCDILIEENRENMAGTSKIELMAYVAEENAKSTQAINEAENKQREYSGVTVEEYLENNSQAVSHYIALYTSGQLENQHYNDRNQPSPIPQFGISQEHFPETIQENKKKCFYSGSCRTSTNNRIILDQENKERNSQFGSQLDESYLKVYSDNDRKNFESIGVISEETLRLEPEIEMETDAQGRVEKHKGEDISSEAKEHDQNLSGKLEEHKGRKGAEGSDFGDMSHTNTRRVDLDIVSNNKSNSIEEIVTIEISDDMTFEEYLNNNAIRFEGPINDVNAISNGREPYASQDGMLEQGQDNTEDLTAEIHHENDVTVEEYLMNHSKLFEEECTNIECGSMESPLLEDQGNQKMNVDLSQDLYQNTEIIVEKAVKGNEKIEITFDLNKEEVEDEAGVFLGRANEIESIVNKKFDDRNDITFHDSQVQDAKTENVSNSSAKVAKDKPIHDVSDIGPRLDKKEVEEDLSKNLFRKLLLDLGKDTSSATLGTKEGKVLSEEGPDLELNIEVDKIFANREREPALGKKEDEMELDCKEKGKKIENSNSSESQVQNKSEVKQDRFMQNEAGSIQQENYTKDEEIFLKGQSNSSFIETDLKKEAEPRKFTDELSSVNAKCALSFSAMCSEDKLTGKELYHISQDKASETWDSEENLVESESQSSEPSELLQALKAVDAVDELNIDVEVQIKNKVTGAGYDDNTVNSNAKDDILDHLSLQRHFEMPSGCVASQGTPIGGFNISVKKAEEVQIQNRCKETGSTVMVAKGSDESCEERGRNLFKTIMNYDEQMILPEETSSMVIDEITAEAEEDRPDACFSRESQSIINLEESGRTAIEAERCDMKGQDYRKKVVISEETQLRTDWEGKGIRHHYGIRREAQTVEKLVTSIKLATDETLLFDDAESRTYKAEDSFSKHNGSFEKKPTFEALEKDGKDCILSAQVSLELNDVNASFSSQFEKELTLDVNEKDKTFSSDVNTSVTSDVNSEQKVGKATTNESTDVLQDQLSILVTDRNKSRTSQLLLPLIRNNQYTVGAKGAKGVTCLRISVRGIKRMLTGLQTTEGPEKSREKNKISILTEETRPSKIQQEEKVILKKVGCRVNITASSKNHVESKDQRQTDSALTADENEASMQTKDRTSSGDSDYKKDQVKPKRLYIRQKAFDKYSFQHSVEEHGVHDSGLNHRFEMNRTDSEKLFEEGFQVPLHAPGTTAKVLTNEVSTDYPEVGADITVIYNPRTEESCISTKQESEEREITDINSYVVLDNEDVYGNEEHCENAISAKTDVDDGNKISKKRGGWKNKSKVQKESQIKRKKSIKERRERLQSDENENDVFNDAITDLDMDAFDTGVDSAWNTDIDQETLVNESFEQIIVDQKEKASKDICDTNQSPEGNDFDFEIVAKPVMTDEAEAESDFSIGISEDESVTVVMSFDKKLNLLRAIPPTLAPPKPISGYSSEVEDDDETDEVMPRKKKAVRSYHEAIANQDEDEQRKFLRRRKSLEVSDEKEMIDKIGSETETETYADNSEVWKNSQILEYEVDWETPLNEEASDRVIVDSETNIIKIGLRKGMIKGSRVWDKDSQEYRNQHGIVNIKLKTGSERETNQGTNVKEMPVVFMESDRKLEGNTPEKELSTRDFGKAGNSDEDSKKKDAEVNSNLKESLEERRKGAVNDIQGQKAKDEVSPGASLRERSTRERKETALQDKEEESISKESLRGRSQKAEEKVTEKGEKDKGSMGESLKERRIRKGEGTKQQDVEEESNSRESLLEKRQRAAEKITEQDEKEKDSIGESLRERRIRKGEIAQQQNLEEESNSQESLRERRQRALEKVAEQEEQEKGSLEESLQERSIREGKSAKQKDVEEEIKVSEILQEGRQGAKAESNREGKSGAKEGPMGDESSSIGLKERKTQAKSEEVKGSTEVVSDATPSGTSKSSDRKIVEEVMESIKGEVSQYALNEEPPNSFFNVLGQNAEKDKGAVNSQVVKDGKEDAVQLNDRAMNSAASVKNPEIMAVVETMLKTNLPTEHKPETAEWLESVRLKETGFIDKEVIGKSSIHEKITLENAFDEQLLADAEALQYWDRILEIKRMRRLSVQKKKEVAAKSAKDMEEVAHSIDNNRKHLDDNAIQSVPNPSSGAKKDCRSDSGTGKESSYSATEPKKRQLSKSLSPEQEKRVKESSFQQEIERLQARKVDSEVGKQGDAMNEEITVKPDSLKNIFRDNVADPQSGAVEDSLPKSKENRTERSGEQVKKEETNSKSKARKKGKHKAESKGRRDQDETTKKVPLIKVTEPSTEVFFDSEEFEIDEDDEKFIEEVLKQLEERKRERKKQREMEELEELRAQSRMKKALVDEDDLDMEVQSAVCEADKYRESVEDRSDRIEPKDKELSNDVEEQEALEKGNRSKKSRIDESVDGKERRHERILNDDDDDESQFAKSNESSAGVAGKEKLYSKETYENHDASKGGRKKRTSDEDHEDELLVGDGNGKLDAALKGDSASVNVKNQSAVRGEDSRGRPRPGRRGESAKGVEDHEAKRNNDDSFASRAKVRINDNNSDDGVSKEMIDKEKIENEAISQKTPSKDVETNGTISSPRRRQKKYDENQEEQGKVDETPRRLRGLEKEGKMVDISSSSMIPEEKRGFNDGEATQFASRGRDDSIVERNQEKMKRREVRDKEEVKKENEKAGSRKVRRRTAERSDRKSSSIGRENEVTDISRDQSNMHEKLIEDKSISCREKEAGNAKRKGAERRREKADDNGEEHSEVEQTTSSQTYQPEAGEEELSTNIASRNRRYQQDSLGDSDANRPALDDSREDYEENLKDNERSAARRERRSAQHIPSDSKDDVKNENESNDSKHLRRRGRGETDKELKRQPMKQKIDEVDYELSRDEENESKDSYSEGEKTRRGRRRRYEEKLDDNPQSSDQKIEIESSEKERRLLRRNRRKDRDQADDSIVDSSDAIEPPRERRRRRKIESDKEGCVLEKGGSKTAPIDNENIDENLMEEDIDSFDLKTRAKSSGVREQHDGEKDAKLVRDSSKMEEKAEDKPVQRRGGERTRKQENQSAVDRTSTNKDLNGTSSNNDEKKDKRKSKYKKNEAPVNRESETEASNEEQAIPGTRRRRKKKQLDEKNKEDAKPRERRERRRVDDEEESNLASSTRTKRPWKQEDSKDIDIEEKSEVEKNSAASRVQQLPETSKDDIVAGKERRDENDRRYKHPKKKDEVAETDKLRASKDNDEEMVGVLRSPSSRNEWKGVGSDRSDVESRSESEKGEAEDGLSNKELDKSVSEQNDDGKLIGSRRSSSCRNEWKNEGETSRTEREGMQSSQRDFLGEEDPQRNKSTNIDNKSTASDGRKDQQLQVTKQKLKHGSKESLEQMIGSIRSSSTRDEWKEIFKNQPQP